MSRTKRYVPHWVIQDHLHPWKDPVTGLEYNWKRNEHQMVRAKQREAARLRGDDGRCPQWRDYWVNRNGQDRTQGRKLINEGLQDHYDELDETYEEYLQDMFDEHFYEQMLLEEYERDLQDEIDQREMEAEMLDDYWDDYYDDYDDYDITHNPDYI